MIISKVLSFHSRQSLSRKGWGVNLFSDPFSTWIYGLGKPLISPDTQMGREYRSMTRRRRDLPV